MSRTLIFPHALLDIHSIHTGDFRKVIAEHLRKSRVVLAIIGKDWLTRLKSADRADGQEDYLRLEIEQAVETSCMVIPVYCDDIKCLSKDDLPSSLEPLAFANAIWVVAGPDFDAQVAKLIREIDRVLSPTIPGRGLRWLRRLAARHRAAAWLCGFLVLLTLTFKVSPPARNWLESRYLRFKDPTLFQGSPTGEYRVARMFPGSHAVKEQSTFAMDAAQTQSEFCVLFNTFGFYRDQVTTFEQLAGRGVKLRFIVTAFDEENRIHWETFARLVGEPNVKETVAQAEAIRCMILALKSKFPKQVELRLNREPLFYTMWLRDPHEPTGVGHVGLHYYSDKSRWPSFRVSQSTGQEMLPLMAEQFEEAWKKSKPADPNECQPQDRPK